MDAGINRGSTGLITFEDTHTFTEAQRYHQRNIPGLIKSLWVILLVICSPSALAELEIEGLKQDELIDNLRAHISLSDLPCETPHWYIVQQTRQLGKQVAAALQPYGYYSPTYTHTLDQEDECWTLTLTVESGPQILLRQISINQTSQEAVPNDLQTLINTPPLVSGQPLRHSQYDEYKQQLLDKANALGYLDAQFNTSELAIYPEKLAADIHLSLEPGERYRFGELNFSESPLEEDLLDRLAGPVTGEYYTTPKLEKVYQRLQNSDYFRYVVISPDKTKADEERHVPLDVNLAMNSETSFSTGIGYSTDQGPCVTSSYQNRYRNREGHQWGAEGLWSHKQEEITLHYQIPEEDPAVEWTTVTGGYRHEINSSYQSHTILGGIQRSFALADEWVMKTGINYTRESYTIGDEPSDVSQLITPEIQFGRIKSDNKIRQLNGLRLETRISASHDAWLSDTDFLQGQIFAKWIKSVSSKGRFITRVEAGGTLKDDFSELPPSVRFFTGGDNSIRGYSYRSVGTEDDQGEVIGGSHLLVGSVEYDHLIGKRWSVSLFTDAGDAYDKSPDYKRSWGMGIRWYSPLGPLRLDVAKPLDSDESYRIHVSVGIDL